MSTQMNTERTRIICELIPVGKTPAFTPNSIQKVVHLVRHGQVFAMAKHKEGTACKCIMGKPGCPYLNEELTDARLTQRGRIQATAVGTALLQTSPVPDLVFVSPLWRTLETATIALSRCPDLKLPIIADENLRERNGVHVCDKRSPADQAQLAFPNVDFHRIQPGPDSLFSPEIRETEEELAERGSKFFLSLRDLPEQSFAVFAHSSFLYNTITRAFETSNPDLLRRFNTVTPELLISADFSLADQVITEQLNHFVTRPSFFHSATLITETVSRDHQSTP